MKIKKYEIEGLLSFTPRIFKDDRGVFFESFNQNVFTEIVGSKIEFVQDNQSLSSKNVLRGLHMQAPPFAQGKLVRVTKGSVLDVAVDLRKSSATYGKSESILLSEENNTQFWVPPGFAHGFLVLEDETIFNYKCTAFYNKESERSIMGDDKDLNIDWGIEEPLLSEKDLIAETFNDFNTPFK